MASAWSLLADKYSCSEPFNGQSWNFQNGMLGLRDEIDPTLEALQSYRAALHIGANSEGLHLSLFLISRFGRPPLFIPWRDISTSEAEGAFLKKMKLDFRAVPRVSLYISDWLGRDVMKYACYSQPAT